ncbi:hypothetical protein M8828_01175 [Aeromonas simiae]|uniref:hypothetical protein n=1 Tax=Aeromonas simiae TaxID=218936 RepID=UPI00266DC4A2|nr:hypothetical protein [Aeromonas simiae]MDO2946972.1 hypothetical protein [Aeromonas simiae]MDO2954434.1 hypothetical protein [Aeromonas simiae]
MTEQTTGITAGEVANAATTAMLAQIDLLTSTANDTTRAALQGLRALVISNAEAIITASNGMIDGENALHDRLSAAYLELEGERAQHNELKIQCSRLIAARRQDEDNVRKIESASAQVATQRDAYKRDADEWHRAKPEMKKLRERLKRLEEAGAKREAENNELRMKLQRTESLLMRAARGVVQAKGAIQSSQQRMLLEGLEVEHTIEVKGVCYYIYRRPCAVADTFKPTDEQIVSRDHMYAFRVETSAGYHWDAIPLLDGDVGIVKHKAMPAPVKKYLIEQYKKEALFDFDKAMLRSEALGNNLGELNKVMAELDGIDHSLTPLKVADSLKQTRARKLKMGVGRKAA